MQVSLKGICRGEGVVCARVRISGCSGDGRLFLESFSEQGNPLPSRLLVEGFDAGAGAFEALAVVPLAGRRFQTLVFFVADEAGSVSSAEVRLGMLRAALESKANRLFRKSLVGDLGRMEAAPRPDRVDVRFGPVAPSARPGELSVHASARIDCSGRFEPMVSVLDSTGAPLGVPVVVHCDRVRPVGSDDGAWAGEFAFSFSVPEDVGSLIVAVRDRLDGRLGDFRALEPAAFSAGRRAAHDMATDASLDPRYDRWFRANRVTERELARQREASRDAAVTFSIVVPLYRTPVGLFEEMLASVRAQSYGRWELVLVLASPDDGRLADAVGAAAGSDGRVRCVVLEENRGIVGNTNAGIRAARGDYVCFLDHDDVIEPDALFEYARVVEAHPDAAMIYCDEDKLLADGHYVDGFFKSDFNIDRLRAQNYLCHFMCIARSVLDSVELSASRHEGAQDHDLALKVSERSGEIYHVAKVLYHWRAVEGSTATTGTDSDGPKPYANDAGHLAISEHLGRLGIAAEVSAGSRPFTHRVKYLVQGEPLVSIVIPNKDASDLLERCVSSILGKTAYRRFEVIIVENGSVEERTFDYYRSVERVDERVRVVTWPDLEAGGFNYSALVNFGAAQAEGDYLLLLNNDTEVIAGEWLECMLGMCQRDDVGAVGAKLLFQDGSIQHAGVVLDGGALPAYHLFSLLPEEHGGNFLQASLACDYSAVTAACMMTPRSVFDEVGGFDEGLAVLYNDVDYCLKVRERGLLVVYEPAARLYHHESASRGGDYDTPEKKRRALAEADALRSRWGRVFEEGDPYSNPHLEPPYARLRLS